MSPSPACEVAKQAGWWYTIDIAVNILSLSPTGYFCQQRQGGIPRPGAGHLFPLSPTGHFLSLAREELFRAPARVTFGRSPKSDQKVCLKPPLPPAAAGGTPRARRRGTPPAAAGKNAGWGGTPHKAPGRSRARSPTPQERRRAKSRGEGGPGRRARHGRPSAARAERRLERGGRLVSARQANAKPRRDPRSARAGAEGRAAERSGDRGWSEAQQPRSRSGEQPGATGDPPGAAATRRSGRRPAGAPAGA